MTHAVLAPYMYIPPAFLQYEGAGGFLQDPYCGVVYNDSTVDLDPFFVYQMDWQNYKTDVYAYIAYEHPKRWVAHVKSEFEKVRHWWNPLTPRMPRTPGTPGTPGTSFFRTGESLVFCVEHAVLGIYTVWKSVQFRSWVAFGVSCRTCENRNMYKRFCIDMVFVGHF